jgi:hypothetical protein
MHDAETGMPQNLPDYTRLCSVNRDLSRAQAFHPHANSGISPCSWEAVIFVESHKSRKSHRHKIAKRRKKNRRAGERKNRDRRSYYSGARRSIIFLECTPCIYIAWNEDIQSYVVRQGLPNTHSGGMRQISAPRQKEPSLGTPRLLLLRWNQGVMTTCRSLR